MTDGMAQERDRIGAAVMRQLNGLARHSSEPDALTRLYLTPAHRAAVDEVAALMREAGLEAALDAVGTLRGLLPAEDPEAPLLLLGSHIDTVRNAGRYDGTLGVVAAIAAVAEVKRRRGKLPFGIEVLAFGDEEGVRFPATLAGSRAAAGIFDTETLSLADAEGVTLEAALRAFGCDPAAIPSVSRRGRNLIGYVEVHIEQGPVLEAEGLPVGIVSAIAGAGRFRATLRGRAGHAGTVPMHLRRDAAAAAAEMVLAVERTARDTPDLVATVGRIETRPGAPNVIAGEALFSLDIRSPREEVRAGATERIAGEFEVIASARGVSLALEQTYEQAAVICDSGLAAALERALARIGVRPLYLPSGAGHDGLALAGLCPVAMLFVRCAGGISHHPDESIMAADAGTAVLALAAFIEEVAG